MGKNVDHESDLHVDVSIRQAQIHSGSVQLLHGESFYFQQDFQTIILKSSNTALGLAQRFNNG
jgi:hypothetical protein